MRATEILNEAHAATQLPGYDSKNPMHGPWAAAFRRRKHSAPKSGTDFNITQEQAWEIINKQVWKCALTGVPFSRSGSARDLNSPSADRIDSSKGYIPGNVQYVRLVVNLAKRELSDADFITLCKQVATYNK